ncbi:MAG: hypothetical protein KDC27_12855 [Acidobacteria bacterium]|nr:hypothetical protein [Acidobacteriota bacterium]
MLQLSNSSASLGRAASAPQRHTPACGTPNGGRSNPRQLVHCIGADGSK